MSSNKGKQTGTKTDNKAPKTDKPKAGTLDELSEESLEKVSGGLAGLESARGSESSS